MPFFPLELCFILNEWLVDLHAYALLYNIINGNLTHTNFMNALTKVCMVICLLCIPNRIDECFSIYTTSMKVEQYSFTKLEFKFKLKIKYSTNHTLIRTEYKN